MNTTTPSTTIDVPLEVLQRIELFLRQSGGYSSIRPTESQRQAVLKSIEPYLTPPSDLPAGVAGEENPQPDYRDLWDAFVNGAREARANPTANENDFNRAADGYCKLVHIQKAPEFTALIEGRKLTRVDIGDGVVIVTDGKPMSPEFQARVLANPAGVLKRQMEVANATPKSPCPDCGHNMDSAA